MNGRRPCVSAGDRRGRVPGRAVRQALILLLLAAGVAGTGAVATAQARSSTPLAAIIQQAKAGNPSAEFVLAGRYYSGHGGLPKNRAHAVQWCQRAAAQGYAPAEYDLGVMYKRGEGGLPKSPAQALKWWKKAAAQGDADAEDDLGTAYYTGEGGLPKSDVQAVKWWEKAAAQGAASAEVNLGNSYYKGSGGLTKSGVQAVKWWERAAAQGYAPAEYRMGLAYILGVGQLTQDPVQAVKWWEKAAAQGYAPAIAQLRSLRHQQQEAVAQSRPRAKEAAVVHSARSAPAAPPPDHQRLVRSLQSFWALYFRASDAQVVDFGAPALVRPVSFGSGS